MAVRKSGLGKGLDSLIPTAATVKPKKVSSSEEQQSSAAASEDKLSPKDIMKVKITKVEPNREQPRKQFDEDALLELADSIKQFGILQPLLVQQKDDYYEIIAGERRWRAAKLAGIREVPVIVKQFSEQETVEISLIENIQRENLNPIEEAIAYKRLMEEFHLKQDQIADRVSKSRTAVTNSMRLLKLNEKVRQMVIDEMLSTGHARALLAIEDLELQYVTATRVFDEKLSVRETEKLVKELLHPKKLKEVTKDTTQDIIYQHLEERIKSIIGTKVAINRKNDNKGKIEIEYYSKDELERIIELLESIG